MTPLTKTWIDALRSGKYKQGTNYLNRGENMCCLGVACEVYIEQGNPLNKKMHDSIMGIQKYGEEEETAALPQEVQKAFDMAGYFGEFNVDEALRVKIGDELFNKVARITGSPGCAMLSELNDQGLTFEEIATIIEAEPANLFFKHEPAS